MADITPQPQQVYWSLAKSALMAVTVLAGVAFVFKRTAIETDLLQRTRQALVEANLPVDKISFSGRDGILQGAVLHEEDISLLQEVVQTVYGVRSVDNRLELATPDNPPQLSGMEGSSTAIPEPSGVQIFVPHKQYPVEQIDLRTVRFPYAKSTLDINGQRTLDAVVTELESHPGMTIEVSAHTDSEGTALGNLAVTQTRAEAVKDYMVSKGIPAQRITAKGYGSTRPVAGNDSDDGRVQNRRVEITVLQE